MTKFFKLLASLLLASVCSQSFAQSVGISSTAISPDPDAVLEVRSTTKGVLLPRLTVTERGTYTAAANSNTGLAAADKGMTIFNTTSNTYNYWDGGQWLEMQTTAGTSGVFVENQNTVNQSADFRISGNGTIQTALGLGTLANSSTSRVLIHDASATAGELQLLVRDNASLPILSVQDIGRVGIGTAAPDALLEVQNSITNNSVLDILRLQTRIGAANQGLAIQFRNRWANTGAYWTMARIEAIEQSGWGGQLVFSTNHGNGPADDITIEAMRIDENGNVGIGVTAPNSKLDIDGDVTLTGKINSNGLQESSDRRFKKEIEPLSDALLNLLALEGVSYKWRKNEFPERNFGGRTEIGLIAQDLESVYPELVSTDRNGYKSVQYSHLVPVLIEAIKEQQTTIGSLSNSVLDLTSSLETTTLLLNEMKADLSGLKSDMNAVQMLTEVSKSK